MIQLAGRFLNAARSSPQVQRFLAGGGKELISSSVPGAVLTGGLSALSTGNPLAGLVVGAADLVTSSALARGLGSKTLGTALEKAGAPKAATALAGRYETIVPQGGKAVTRYSPSTPQHIAMGVGSIGSTLMLEPLFHQTGVDQLAQQPYVASQTATADQQMLQRDLINRLHAQQQLSPGTMYQLQGLPERVQVPYELDPYMLSGGNV